MDLSFDGAAESPVSCSLPGAVCREALSGLQLHRTQPYTWASSRWSMEASQLPT